MHQNKGLALIVVGATLICGESAAVAISSTIKGNPQDLTLVTSMIALISIFQIIFIPIFCRLVQMNDFVAGGWVGGSVDTTGGVIAIGESLGGNTYLVSSIVKIIQNAMIGVICVFIAFYWITFEEKQESDEESDEGEVDKEGVYSDEKKKKKKCMKCPSLVVLYDRFPKFVLGYFFLSVIYSFIVEPFSPILAKEVYSMVN